MAITVLDSKTALILIDLQKGIVAYPSVHPIGEVVKHAAALADAFRSHGLPVVLVNVAGGSTGADGAGSHTRRVSSRMG